MTDSPRLDPERLAALLDGRVVGEARARLLEELSLSEADLEVLADAAAAMDATDSSTERPNLTVSSGGSASPRVNRWRGRIVWSALAAAVVVVVALPLMRRAPDAPWTLDRALDGLAVGALPTTTAWSDSRAGAGAMSATGRSVRIGALVADLRAATADEASRAARIGELATLVDGLDGAAPIAQALRDAASSGAPSAATLESVIRAAGEAALAGAWIEAARVAAARHDAAFFESDNAPRALAQVGLVVASDADEGRNAVSALQVALAGVPRDWSTLSAAIDRVLVALSR